MSKPLQHDLAQLLEKGIIDAATAQKISDYYAQQPKDESPNRLLLIFGVLGALLVGLGIILIIGHNWDNLSRGAKLVIAFTPLVIAQGICAFSLLRKNEQRAWRETASVLLILAIGACIAMISQIYHRGGDMNDFLFVWILLALPIPYLMRSSIAAVFLILGITMFGINSGYWRYESWYSNVFWLFWLAMLPYYYLLYKKNPQGNAFHVHSWLLCLSLVITFGSLARHTDLAMFATYLVLFCVFHLIGLFPFFEKKSISNNPYLVIGSLGSMFVLLTGTFHWFWKDVFNKQTNFHFWELILAFLLGAVAIFLVFLLQKSRPIKTIPALCFSFIPFIICYFIAPSNPDICTLLINLLVFAIGLQTLLQGTSQKHLGMVNYGLLIISVLIACRFFDSDWSFVLKGIVFLLLGLCFFAVNYFMLKKTSTK